MENKILNQLKNCDTYLSGEELSNILNVSRTAVWKHIKNLKAKGYIIEGISKKGYKLISCPDSLCEAELIPLLKENKLINNIVHFDILNSTNIKAKELAKNGEKDGTIIIAEEQSSGNGRFQRVWNSPKGGIWFSLLLKPSIPPSEAPKITQIAAASLYKTFSDLNIDTAIKWPNDIYLNDKKLCGILAEMKCDMDSIHYLVLGIGINVNIDLSQFDDCVKSTATSLKIEYNKSFERNKVLALFLSHFENLYSQFINNFDLSETIELCRKHSNIWGKKARLITYKNEEIVTCVSLSDKGDLIVKDINGIEKAVLSGEISFNNI